jgi:hypothetical protein
MRMTVSNMDSTSGADVTFRRYDAVSARRIRAVVEAVYVGSYVEAIASGDPFDSVEAFMHRFDSYTSGSSFDLVVAYHGDDAIGQTWGWPLDERATTTGWWDGLLPGRWSPNFCSFRNHGSSELGWEKYRARPA